MSNFTERAIIDTFEEMLSEMPFDRITVTALAKRCGISPNTFYYHYEDIYDLLEHWLRRKKEYFEEKTQNIPSTKDRLKFVLTKCREHEKLVYNLMDSLSRERIERFFFGGAEDLFCEWIREISAGMEIPEERMRTISQLLCYSTLGFLLRFFWLRMRVDIDHEVDNIYGILEETLKIMLKESQK